jgi:hypothetical protein
MRQGEIDLKINVMKKLIILFVAILFCFDGAIANSISNTSSLPDLVITFTINLHSKKSNCQNGFGFCKVTVGISWKSESDNLGGNYDLKAQGFINSSNQLVIRIQDSDLQKYESGESVKYFRGKKSIIIDDTYELSKEVSSALGSTSNIIIKPGEYPVQYNSSYYELVIQL